MSLRFAFDKNESGRVFVGDAGWGRGSCCSVAASQGQQMYVNRIMNIRNDLLPRNLIMGTWEVVALVIRVTNTILNDASGQRPINQSM